MSTLKMDLDRNGQYSDSESIASDCSSNDEDEIHVGSEYQASVPNNVLDKSFCYLELDKSDPIWIPPKANVSCTELDQFLKEASSFNICEEQALSLLHHCCYDMSKAQQILPQTKRYVDTLDKWSHEEKEHFINAYNYHGKKFKLIQASLPNKSIADLVDYYYTWKKTRNSVSLITQYCNVLALQHGNTLIEDFTEDKSQSLEVTASPSPSSTQTSVQTALGDKIDSIEPLSSQTSTITENMEVLSSQTSTITENMEVLSSQTSTIIDNIESSSSQISSLEVNIDSIEPTLLSQDIPLSSVNNVDLNIAPSIPVLPISSCISPDPCDSPSTMNAPNSLNSNTAVCVSNPSEINEEVHVLSPNEINEEVHVLSPNEGNTTANVLNSDVHSTVLNLKNLVPEHLNYLLECLESNDALESTEDVKHNIEDDVTRKASSAQLGSMFARCTMCKNILDTWSFSSDQGIVCYSCKPSDEECKEEVESTIGVDSKEPGHCIEDNLTALNKLNEVCKQTCNEEEPHEVPESSKTKDPDSKIQDTIRKTEDPTSESQDPTVKTQDPTSKTQDPASKTQDPTSSTLETTRRLHKLKLVPRGLYFNVVDFIEIATNKTDFVDDMFKRMDRDVSNLVKKVRSNNIHMDAILDQIDSKLPLDKYRSHNNNNTGDKSEEDKVGVLWSETEIFLVLQGFLKYGMDFETIAEILETKTYKQVGYFYQVNKSYYDLDVLIREHNSNRKAAKSQDSEVESMEVDIS